MPVLSKLQVTAIAKISDLSKDGLLEHLMKAIKILTETSNICNKEEKKESGVSVNDIDKLSVFEDHRREVEDDIKKKINFLTRKLNFCNGLKYATSIIGITVGFGIMGSLILSQVHKISRCFQGAAVFANQRDILMKILTVLAATTAISTLGITAVEVYCVNTTTGELDSLLEKDTILINELQLNEITALILPEEFYLLTGSCENSMLQIRSYLNKVKPTINFMSSIEKYIADEFSDAFPNLRKFILMFDICIYNGFTFGLLVYLGINEHVVIKDRYKLGFLHCFKATFHVSRLIGFWLYDGFGISKPIPTIIWVYFICVTCAGIDIFLDIFTCKATFKYLKNTSG